MKAQNDIVLIRGLFRGKAYWGDFPHMVQQRFPSRTVRCVEIAGVGERCQETSSTTIHGMMEQVRQQIELPAKVDIISISMGGMIAMEWAHYYPHEVNSLVCINTSAKDFSPFYQRLQPSNYMTIMKALFSAAEEKESMVFGMVSNQPQDPSIIDRWVALTQQYPLSRANFFRQLLAAARFKIQRPESDLLLICSRHDRLVSCKTTQAIAHHWHQNYLTHDESGHDLPLDDPKWLIARLEEWFEKDA